MTVRALRAWLCGGWLLSATALAHPVAQGSLEVRIARDHVALRARVSVEEVFVESSLAKGRPPAATLDELWPQHGAYLLAHLAVSADGAPLAGRVVSVAPPASPAASQFVVYELDYAFPTAPPARLALHQDLLNEFDFAPGNKWEATFVVRVEQEGQPAQEALLLTARQPLEIACDWNAPTAGSAPREIDRRRLTFDYLRHGVLHILAGWDHLLFMAALVLAAVTFGDLIKVVTAFTLAHTLTLTLSVLDLVRLPSRVVEPMIAMSIVFVAVQNLFWPQRTRGWGRLLIAFGFGLFHGLGFAGGLLEAMQGLPGVAIGIAIAAFSLGVEIGHQAVVLPVFFGLRIARATRTDEIARQRLSLSAMRFGSAAISVAGMFYLLAALRN
ncbi:MAG: hypothetical protein QOE70_2800 [Chthoniobacter sp.]|jgi:hydrogenase/urease accessory protein HupE|nr:hypothetical protein [Chthoniobacter sp.]